MTKHLYILNFGKEYNHEGDLQKSCFHLDQGLIDKYHPLSLVFHHDVGLELDLIGRLYFCLSFISCPGTESNCRHEDFQSSALPTELPGLEYYLSSGTNPSGITAPSPNKNFSISSSRNFLALGSTGVNLISFINIV